MRKSLVRYLLLSAALMLVASGCLRSASDAEFQAPESLGLSSPTPEPTWTPLPPVFDEVDEVEEAAEEPPDFLPLIPLEEDEEDEVFEPPAEIALPPVDEAPAVAQADPPATATLDPLFIEATEIVGTATQQIIDLTLTAEGPPIDFPTAEPTFDIFVPTETPVPDPVFPGGECVHTVAQGDNLFRISLRYGSTVETIAAANGISNINLIRPGQQLRIPNCTTGGAPGTGGPVIPSGRTHTVAQGETLFQISMRYGTLVMDIARANGISNINMIYIGQQLVIP